MRCYVFDLDGTICNIDHRLHYILEPATVSDAMPRPAPSAATPGPFKPDWDSFFAACVGDTPIEPICGLLADLARQAPIVFCSGRSDAVWKQTVQWIRLHVPGVRERNFRVYMRKEGDHRRDDIVKGELLDQILADGYKPVLAFEDRTQVVEMYRKRGIQCCQVAPGDF